MRLYICNCRYCRMSKSRRRALVKARRHWARSRTRCLLRICEYDAIPWAVIVGYTD